MYWLTGSQQFHLMKNVSESLAGRVGILHLEGFSQSERDGKPERSPFLPMPEAIEARAAHAPKTDIEAIDVIETVLKQKRGHGAVLCMAQTHLPITAEVDAVPIPYI